MISDKSLFLIFKTKKKLSKEEKKDHPNEPGKSSHNDFPIQEHKNLSFGYARSQDDIDLLGYAKTIWVNRKTIYKFVGVGVVLGIVVALLTPKEYVSSATLLPEYSTQSQSGASSLLKQYGGLLGISGGSYSSNSNAIRVDLYPKIVQSLNFQDQLAREEFYFPDYDTTISFYEYYLEVQKPGTLAYIKKYTIGLPGIIVGAVVGVFNQKEKKLSSVKTDEASIKNKEGVVELSKNDMAVIGNLRNRVSAILDKESGVVTVRAQMSNPRVAANVAKYTIEELTSYLTEYRTEKVLRDLRFIEEQLAKAETRFQKAKIDLAEFRDSNQGVGTAKSRTEEQSLRSEYDITFNLYSSLTQQFEEAKLKVQEETPVFKELQPVQVPISDVSNGKVTLILYTFFSLILSIVWIFTKQFLATSPFEKLKKV